MAKQVTETTPFLSLFDLEAHNQQVLHNNIAFQKAKTHDERYRLNNELEKLVRQIEEATG